MPCNAALTSATVALSQGADKPTIPRRPAMVGSSANNCESSACTDCGVPAIKLSARSSRAKSALSCAVGSAGKVPANMACATRWSTRRAGPLSLPLTSPGCSSATAPPAAASTMAELIPNLSKVLLCIVRLSHTAWRLRSPMRRGFPERRWFLRLHRARSLGGFCLGCYQYWERHRVHRRTRRRATGGRRRGRHEAAAQYEARVSAGKARGESAASVGAGIRRCAMHR